MRPMGVPPRRRSRTSRQMCHPAAPIEMNLRSMLCHSVRQVPPAMGSSSHRISPYSSTLGTSARVNDCGHSSSFSWSSFSFLLFDPCRPGSVPVHLRERTTDRQESPHFGGVGRFERSVPAPKTVAVSEISCVLSQFGARFYGQIAYIRVAAFVLTPHV